MSEENYESLVDHEQRLREIIEIVQKQTQAIRNLELRIWALENKIK